MNQFHSYYKIQENPTPVSEELITEYENKVPHYLINLWKSDGLGKYNAGLIETINPKDFEAVLWTWLGKEVDNYVPFAIMGFGELFYYRKLTETDEDVCIIDIQHGKIYDLTWDFEIFFEGFLLDDEDRKNWLREPLFKKAIKEKGGLERYEIFTFVPILMFGAKEEVAYLEKGNAQVYENIVFQLTP